MNQTALATMLKNDFLMLEESRSGVSKESFSEIRKAFPFHANEWEEIIGTDRHFEQVTYFNGATAERLLLVLQITQKGISVFGTFEIFRKWLTSNIPALGGKTPISFMNNSIGLRILEDELGRIEHGIFA